LELADPAELEVPRTRAFAGVVQVRHLHRELLEVLHGAVVERRRIEHRDGDRHLERGLLAEVGGDDDLLERIARLGLNGERQWKRGERRANRPNTHSGSPLESETRFLDDERRIFPSLRRY